MESNGFEGPVEKVDSKRPIEKVERVECTVPALVHSK